jgi:hypothetical protein
MTSRLDLGPTHPRIQWVLGALTPAVKRQGCEVNHLPPSSDEGKNAWSYTSTPSVRLMVWCLIKQEIRLYDIVRS